MSRLVWHNNPYFWVQVAVAIGTLGVVGLAWLNERIRRREYEAARYAQALEEFVAPALEVAEAIHRFAQPQPDPYRRELRGAAQRLQAVLVTKRARAYRVSGELLASAQFTVALAHEVAGLLAHLKDKENAILDDWGSALSGNANMKEHPRVSGRLGQKAIQLEDANLVEAVLKRMQLNDLLRFLLPDEFTEVHWRVIHGNKEVYAGAGADHFMKLLFERFSREASLGKLPTQLDQLRLESEKLAKDLGGLVTEYGRKSALH